MKHPCIGSAGAICIRRICDEILSYLCRKGEVTATMLIGEVVLVHVLEAVTARTGHDHVIVDIDKFAPVSRMGGDSYARVTELYDIPRPGKEWQERSAAVVKAQKMEYRQ